MDSKKQTITAHVIVKNEECFVTYAILSVVDFVDHVLVFDNGSTDSTVEVLSDLAKQYPDKITFEEKGSSTKEEHTALRQEMLERTKTDWFLIVDGDEVYTERGIKEIVDTIQDCPTDKNWLVSPYYLCMGDVHHTYFNEKYDPFYDRVGYFTPRAVRNIEGLYWSGAYELDTLYTEEKKMLYQKDNLYFLKHKYWHLTHLLRSHNDKDVFTSGIEKTRMKKRRLTYIGISTKIKEDIPEVFIGSEYEKQIPFVKALGSFFMLVITSPRLFLRKLGLGKY